MILLTASLEVRMLGILRPNSPIQLMKSRPAAIVMVLTLGLVSQAMGQAPLSAQPANHPVSNLPTAAVHNRSIKLSWGESKPASKLAQDAVIGYNVYRSKISRDPQPQLLNLKPLPGTTYVDSDVTPGITYFYVTRGVTAKGVLSGPSNEAHAKIPLP
jgi:hypothetical protein